MRFEIEVVLGAESYSYILALTLLKDAKDLLVLEERLDVGGRLVFSRDPGQVSLEAERDSAPSLVRLGMDFPIDLRLVALPIIQPRSSNDPLPVFRQWLARMLILRPIPSLISGDSKEETLEPSTQVTDFGAWFSGLLAHAPSAYAAVDSYLKQVMPDLGDIKNPVTGTDSRTLVVQFSTEQSSMTLPFEDLSDGEKCYMICALVIAANKVHGPVFCFWDEPDNFLALSEVGDFVMALRKAFKSGGQFIATSHNPEAIRRFSDENTFVLYRSNHLEPTRVRPLKDIHVTGDLVGALIRDDLEP